MAFMTLFSDVYIAFSLTIWFLIMIKFIKLIQRYTKQNISACNLFVISFTKVVCSEINVRWMMNAPYNSPLVNESALQNMNRILKAFVPEDPELFWMMCIGTSWIKPAFWDTYQACRICIIAKIALNDLYQTRCISTLIMNILVLKLY